ncbi:MAG: 30S ribosome-binding factor RbfA [Ignavibacteriales bacterium]|nr:30S ribosome-binding factor RbfA [Ignavibacteriales bacterium]
MSLRTEKVASLIKEEIGSYIAREYRDPAYGFITVTDVIVTPDLRIAKIYVSIMGTDAVKSATLKMLEDNKGELRMVVGSHLRLKFTPAINLYLDETLDRVEKIEKLLKQIHQEEDNKNTQ